MLLLSHNSGVTKAAKALLFDAILLLRNEDRSKSIMVKLDKWDGPWITLMNDDEVRRKERKMKNHHDVCCGEAKNEDLNFKLCFKFQN